jgi:hypothetical protein
MNHLQRGNHCTIRKEGPSRSRILRVNTVHNVMEEVGDAGGYHQALLLLPRHRRKLETDGTIRREAIYRYG